MGPISWHEQNATTLTRRDASAQPAFGFPPAADSDDSGLRRSDPLDAVVGRPHRGPRPRRRGFPSAASAFPEPLCRSARCAGGVGRDAGGCAGGCSCADRGGAPASSAADCLRRMVGPAGPNRS